MNVNKTATRYVDAAPQAPNIPRERRVGFLPWLKHLIVGERDPIQAQLHEVERQGKGMARLMHVAGYLMLVLFSIGSAIGICGSIIQEIATGGQLLTWHSVVLEVVVLVSLMLVFCMDLADIYAAFMIRLLATRRAPKRAYTLHIIVIAVATVLEGATFILMSYTYDNVIGWFLAALVIARGVFAPLFAIYLNMARAIPVGVADIAYHSFLAAGQGVVRDTIVIANDSNASLAEKAELMSASAYVSNHEQATLDRIIAASKKREDAARNLPALAAPEPRNRIYAASYAIPEPTQAAHTVPLYRAMHDGWPGDETPTPPPDPFADEVYDDDDDDLFGTTKLEQDELDSVVAANAAMNHAKQGARGPVDSRPSARNNVSKIQRDRHAAERREAKARRRSDIRDAVYAILDEWYATGSQDRISDRDLARRVSERVNFAVNPSGNTVARWRGPWQSSRAHKVQVEREAAVFAADTISVSEPVEELEGVAP